MNVIDKMVAIHLALDAAAIPYAFGGALALAWCTEQARGTLDIDLNLFVGVDEVPRALAALPPDVTWTDDDLSQLRADGQARLRWDDTPVDVFFNTTEFHERAASRARVEPFAGHHMPFLACRDLAVFKAFFDRTRHWADLEAMAEAGTLDVSAVAGVLVVYLGAGDDRIARLRALA